MVLDNFAGVCTTLVQAARMGRSSIGCELNPIYATAGIQRIERDPYAMNMVLPLFGELVVGTEGVEEPEVGEVASIGDIDF